MPAIELIAGEQSVKDFTLHDSQHAWRVAALMVDVMSEEIGEQLSSFELGLLLASAYLHDIGMSPAYHLVRSHVAFLDGEASSLSEDDRQTFLRWLDREHEGVEPPIQDRRLANLLLMQYIRDRHVAWGERWVREELAARIKVPAYEEFVDDLIRICRSHHQGYRELASDEFAPRFLHWGKTVVHRRYLACVLRVADVLEVDPERTPPVLFAHREIIGESATYWHKDHAMDLSIEADGRVVVEAEPANAVLYRAIEETIAGIEVELRLCRDLDATHPFGEAPNHPARKLPHRWKMEPVVYPRILPKDGKFVYVDGAFRPDNVRLLELLGGRELYGESELAVRELLQNAYDAVSERIGWQRLSLPDPQDDSVAETLPDKHRVDLSIVERDGERWLVCHDTGAGMTKETLVDYLLVSGAGRNPDSLDLGRRARDAGFEVERRGMFGIGVLSYFMLADRLELRTRRCPEAPTAEPQGWSFGTDGVGSFGELRRDAGWREGTEVALRLTEAVDVQQVKEILGSTVIRSPCATVLTAGDEEVLRLPAGWTSGPAEFLVQAQKLLHDAMDTKLERTEEEFLPKYRLAERTRRREAFQEAMDKLAGTINWLTVEGELEGGLGRFLAAVPYLDTPMGISLALVRVASGEGASLLLPGIVRGRIAVFDFPQTLSVGGMKIQSHESARRFHSPPTNRWIAYVDWQGPEGGTVLASRNQLRIGPGGERALRDMEQRVAGAIAGLLAEQPPSPLTRINARLAEWAGVESPVGLESSSWLSWRKAGDGYWSPALAELSPPIVQSASVGSDLKVGRERVSVPGDIGSGLANSSVSVDWESWRQPPAKLVLDLDRARLVGYWPDLGFREQVGADYFPDFPPGAERVVGIFLGPAIAWNSGCAVCAGPWARLPRERESRQNAGKSLDELAVKRALGRAADASRWLFELVRHYKREPAQGESVVDIWDELAQKDSSFLGKVMRLALGDEAATVTLIDHGYGGYGRKTLTFGRDGVNETDEDDLGQEIIRLWSQDGWCIEAD